MKYSEDFKYLPKLFVTRSMKTTPPIFTFMASNKASWRGQEVRCWGLKKSRSTKLLLKIHQIYCEARPNHKRMDPPKKTSNRRFRFQHRVCRDVDVIFFEGYLGGCFSLLGWTNMLQSDHLSKAYGRDSCRCPQPKSQKLSWGSLPEGWV